MPTLIGSPPGAGEGEGDGDGEGDGLGVTAAVVVGGAPGEVVTVDGPLAPLELLLAQPPESNGSSPNSGTASTRAA
jgi:hypothetical protein